MQLELAAHEAELGRGDQPAMGHALHVQRQDIMDRLNHELGSAVVADIRFRLAGDTS